jgi:hypothetical protein
MKMQKIVTIQSPAGIAKIGGTKGLLARKGRPLNEPIRSERVLMPRPGGSGFFASFVKSLENKKNSEIAPQLNNHNLQGRHRPRFELPVRLQGRITPLNSRTG